MGPRCCVAVLSGVSEASVVCPHLGPCPHTHTHTLTHSSVQRPARHPTEDFTLYPTVLPDRERPVCWAGARRCPAFRGWLLATLCVFS